jgi:predicted RNase H-like HicB family nuclease
MPRHKNRKYLVHLEPAEEGGYIVYCPALPGCASQGETVEEALAMIKDAIAGYVASLKKEKQPIPPGLEDVVERVEIVEVAGA